MVYVELVNSSFAAKEDYRTIKNEIKNDLQFIELTEVIPAPTDVWETTTPTVKYRSRYINKIHIVDVVSNQYDEL